MYKKINLCMWNSIAFVILLHIFVQYNYMVYNIHVTQRNAKKVGTTCEIFEKVKCSINLYLKVPVLYNKGR